MKNKLGRGVFDDKQTNVPPSGFTVREMYSVKHIEVHAGKGP